jgi:hypothetical protein
MKRVLHSIMLAAATSAYAEPPSAPEVQASAALSVPMPPARSGVSVEENFFYPPPLPLKKNMVYSEARTKLIAQGWIPANNPYCVGNVLIATLWDEFNNYKGTCNPGEEAEACHVCAQFPEIRACTGGDGSCSVTFIYGSDWLNISLSLDYFNVSGIKEGIVTDWGLLVIAPGRSKKSNNHFGKHGATKQQIKNDKE